jgi:general secretion pathway protein F
MRFRYEAIQGDGRTAVGQVEAPTARIAHRDLLRRGLRPTTLQPAGRQASAGTNRSPRAADLYTMLKEMHALIAGGVPLAAAVSALEEGSANAGLVARYAELAASLRRGESFSAVFARCFPMLPGYVLQVIRAGELTGHLGQALGDAAAQMQADLKVQSELRNALVYPAFLIGFGLLAVLFIFAVVLPRFALIFQGRFDKLPLLSAVVIRSGLWFDQHLAVCLAGLATVIAAVVYSLAQAGVRQRVVECLFHVPLLKRWLGEMETARWAAVLAHLLENRVPLMPSLELARNAIFRQRGQLRLGQVERAVRGGRTLSAALDELGLLPSTALSLIRVGERSGALPEMVRSVADIYADAVRNRTKTALTIIEPIAIVLIGGLIALVAVAVFLAIISINDLPGL